MTAPERPAAGEIRPIRLPPVASAVLDGGIEASAVNRRGAPVIELRLFLRSAPASASEQAAQHLAAETLLAGTSGRDAAAIARALRAIGARVSVSATGDGVQLSASVGTSRLDPALELITEVLRDATFPAGPVAVERARLRNELVVRRSQPTVLADEATGRRLYGRHPYGLGLPAPGALARTSAPALRRWAERRLGPQGASLTIVGDRPGPYLIDRAQRSLDAWTPAAEATAQPEPTRPRPGATRVIDRPGATQTNIRMAAVATPRAEPGYPALLLANMVLGGYFGSRLTDNLRESKGYSYSPYSVIRHATAGSRLVVAADVAAEVTGAALHELHYEIGRLATTDVPQEELDRARRYHQGSLSISLQTKAGLAMMLDHLARTGLDHRWLRAYHRVLNAVRTEQVLDAARTHLATDAMVTVLVGDADRILPQLRPLGPVVVHTED